MNLEFYKETRTGLKVFRLKDYKVPRIGQVVKVDGKVFKVLDVIGRIDSPFVLLKELPPNSISRKGTFGRKRKVARGGRR